MDGSCLRLSVYWYDADRGIDGKGLQGPVNQFPAMSFGIVYDELPGCLIRHTFHTYGHANLGLRFAVVANG